MYRLKQFLIPRILAFQLHHSFWILLDDQSTSFLISSKLLQESTFYKKNNSNLLTSYKPNIYQQLTTTTAEKLTQLARIKLLFRRSSKLLTYTLLTTITHFVIFLWLWAAYFDEAHYISLKPPMFF